MLKYITFALCLKMISFIFKTVLLILLSGALLGAAVYFKCFRYTEVSIYRHSDGATFALMKDDFISGHISYSTCGCFDEAYFLLKANDIVVYKFYREAQGFPNYFKIVNIENDSIVIESNNCFIFKVPMNKKNITRRDLSFKNLNCYVQNYEYLSSDRFVRDYELTYFIFPKIE